MKRSILLTLILLLVAGAGCQTLREIAALRSVAFALDRVTEARLAGVSIDRLRSYQDLSAADVLRLGAAVSQGELPLDFVLHVEARNPEENDVQARLVKMDWTLLLDDRETVSGVFNDNLIFPPGQTVDVPIGIRLDLLDFFDRNAQDLVELALAVTGQGGEPKRVKLQAVPTIDTSIGPIQYPGPITIVSREVGQ